jgi:hypothetical protein
MVLEIYNVYTIRIHAQSHLVIYHTCQEVRKTTAPPKLRALRQKDPHRAISHANEEMCTILLRHQSSVLITRQ